MSLGQSVMAIMALVVITYLVVSANRMISQSLEEELKGEAYNQAGDIANDIINEAMKKKFDDPTVVHVVNQWIWISGYWRWFSSYKLYDFYQSSDDFTMPGSLGPSAAEKIVVTQPDRSPYKSIAGYDDFDDYNNYQRIVDTPVMSGFVVNCTVSYVASTDLNTPISSSRTYYKRLLVKISQPRYLPDALSFSTVMTY
jgi:hypothetical protein